MCITLLNRCPSEARLIEQSVYARHAYMHEYAYTSIKGVLVWHASRNNLRWVNRMDR
jgi:hypothetical protein